MKGTYLLIIKTPEKEVEIGSIGVKNFESDYAVYIGSAFGPGGLKRVLRHFSTDKKIHWHIDYLLKNGELEKALIFPEKDIECSMPEKLQGIPVQGFGCSDCGCGSHLYEYDSIQQLFDDLSMFSDIKVVDRPRYNEYKNCKTENSIDDFISNLPDAKSYQK